MTILRRNSHRFKLIRQKPARRYLGVRPLHWQPLAAGSIPNETCHAVEPALDGRQYAVSCCPGRIEHCNHGLKDKAMIDFSVLVVLLRYTGENIALFSGGLFTGATIYIGPSAKARPSDAARQTPTCSLLFLHRPSLGLGHL